ncbi:MAG: carboxymuconolactone decarboxylase family protein [Acidimicrobiales bacterium]
MARIPLGPLDPKSAVGLNVMRALANHPGAAQAVGQLAAVGYLSDNLTPTQRELAYLAASTINRCHY